MDTTVPETVRYRIQLLAQPEIQRTATTLEEVATARFVMDNAYLGMVSVSNADGTDLSDNDRVELDRIEHAIPDVPREGDERIVHGTFVAVETHPSRIEERAPIVRAALSLDDGSGVSFCFVTVFLDQRAQLTVKAAKRLLAAVGARTNPAGGWIRFLGAPGNPAAWAESIATKLREHVVGRRGSLHQRYDGRFWVSTPCTMAEVVAWATNFTPPPRPVEPPAPRRLYLLKACDEPGPEDKVAGFVVCATSELEARSLAARQALDEGARCWLSADQSTCQDIGQPADDVEVGVVLRDTRAV